MRKKFLSMVLVGLISTSMLIGCGSKQEISKETTAAETKAVSTEIKTEEAKAEETTDVKADTIYTMQIAHGQPIDNPRHISLEAFKKEVEEKTNGGISVEIYPAGQLGTEKEMLEQVCSGVVQGFRGGPIDFLPKLQILTLPFLCETQDDAVKIMSSEFAMEICEGMKETGSTILALGDAGGFRQFSNNVRLIKKPEDLIGLKMRTNGLQTVDAMFKAFGASTVSVPYSDLYMGLKTGVADGQENPWVNVSGMKFYEVQKYFTEINAQFFPDPFYVNSEWYEALPVEYQTIVKEAAVNCMVVNNQAICDNAAAALETIKANAEVYTLTAEERQAFVDAAQVVYDGYIEQGLLTQEELDTMRNIIAAK